MNYYNIQYSPKKKNNDNQRIMYDNKIKIYGSRKLKQKKKSNLILDNEFYKQEYINH